MLTLDNRYLRFQLNPAKSPEVTTLNPTQGTSVMNTNGQNEGETNELFDLNALVIDLGLRQLSRELKLTRKGTLTKKSLAAIRKALISNAESIPGNRDLYYLLTHKDENHKPDISLSLPLIADKVIANLASVFSKASVAFRFPGSKLVLQADFATQDFVNDKGETIREPLKFKDKDGYTEVYVPSTYRQFLSEGDVFTLGGQDGIMGFRIPSSNYHSLLALKVKGFYPAPPGAESNVVIAPGPIVYYHGSDNDVDTLFVIKKSTWPANDTNIFPLVNKYSPTTEDSSAFSLSSSSFVGFSAGSADIIDGQPLHYFLEDIVIQITQDIETKRKDLDNESTPLATKKAIEAELNLLNLEADLLTKVAALSAKNAIVHLFSSNLRDPKNRTDLLTPISFDMVAALRSDSFQEQVAKLAPDLTEEEQVTALQDISDSLEKQSQSLMEVWAKLEADRRGRSLSNFPSKEEIDDLLYPEGELSDFNVQEKIKSNTDAGGAMVGIAANTLKSAAYSFSAEKIMSIRKKSDPSQVLEVGSPELNSLIKASKKGTVENFLRGSLEWEAAERFQPVLKERFQLRMNGRVLNSFRRTSVDFSNGEVLMHNGYPVNIFEVYDTIENLAIDNVKEQKLFILGINNNNANAFLSAIAYGIPLTDISRIFKTPKLAQMFSSGRVAPGVLVQEMKDLAQSIITDGTLAEGLLAFVDEQRANTILKQINLATSQGEDAVETLLSKLTTSLYLDSAVLDRVYTGRLTGAGKDISDILALSTVAKLSGVGDQMFKYAQTLSMLKRYPNAKWRMDQLNDNILKLVEFQGEEAMRSQLFSEHKTNVRNYIKETSQEYKDLLAKDADLAERYVSEQMAQLEASPVFNALPSRLAESSFMNRLMRRSVSREMRATSDNVFRSNNILLLPHVYAAWRGLVQLKALIENSFAMHYHEVKTFAEELLADSGIYVLPYKYYSKVETIQKEFINYLASNMSLELGSETLDLRVDPELTFDSSAGVFQGQEAWCQRYIRDFIKLQEKYPENSLLQSVEVSTDPITSLKRLYLVADKVGNEETVERLRADFKEFARTEDAEAARNLFKYALITKGMFFSRTSFSLIFPEDWAAAYSKSLDARLQTLISKENPAATKLNLLAIKDELLYQFLRLNVNSLRYVDGRPKTVKHVKDKKGYDQEVYRGTDVVDGQVVHFDLMYPDQPFAPKYIRRFDNTVYARMDVDSQTAYYRAIARSGPHNFFNLSEESLDEPFKIKKLLDPSLRIVPHTYLKGGKLVTSDELSVGDVFYIHDVFAPSPRELRIGKVTAIGLSTNGYTSYSYSLEGTKSLIDSTDIAAMRLEAKPLDSTLDARVVTVATAREAVIKAKLHRQKNAVSVVGSGIAEGNTIKLDIAPIDVDNISDDEIAAYVARVKKQIKAIPKDAIVYVTPTLLDPLIVETPDVARQIALAFYHQTGFAFPILSEEQLESKLSYSAQLLVKRREILKALLNKDVALYENTGNSIPYRIVLEDLKKSKSFSRGRLRAGDIIGIGQHNGHNLYAYVDLVDNGNAYLTPFSEDVFMLLEEDNYDAARFYEIVDNHTKC